VAIEPLQQEALARLRKLVFRRHFAFLERLGCMNLCERLSSGMTSVAYKVTPVLEVINLLSKNGCSEILV